MIAYPQSKFVRNTLINFDKGQSKKFLEGNVSKRFFFYFQKSFSISLYNFMLSPQTTFISEFQIKTNILFSDIYNVVGMKTSLKYERIRDIRIDRELTQKK